MDQEKKLTKSKKQKDSCENENRNSKTDIKYQIASQFVTKITNARNSEIEGTREQTHKKNAKFGWEVGDDGVSYEYNKFTVWTWGNIHAKP